MRTAPLRRFTVLDAMVLVAATGAGLTLLRLFLAEGMLFHGAFVRTLATDIAQAANEVAFPFFLSWTPVVLALGLRRPRPRIRRLMRQPGIAACAAATLVLSVQTLEIVIPAVLDWLQWRMAAASQPAPRPQVAGPIKGGISLSYPNGSTLTSASPGSTPAAAPAAPAPQPALGQPVPASAPAPPSAWFPSIAASPTRPFDSQPLTYI
jgi:hypothetical protein